MDRVCEAARGTALSAASKAGRPLRIGLVNAMPDAAYRSAEDQFAGLLHAAAGPRGAEIVVFSLSGVARAPAVLARMALSHRPVEEVADAGLDAVVVTGAEPRRADLREEAFWPAFAALADWTERTGTPALWSCLAAHAAVLHLDGIGRRRLPVKCSGVFPVADARSGAAAGPVPHSRYNALDEADLRRCGYQVLTRSAAAGVDSFSGDGGRLLFCQGHPEYDAEALGREYRRDVLRHLRGEQDAPPALPADYFAEGTEAELRALAARARDEREPGLMAAWPRRLELRYPDAPWRGTALALYGGWLQAALRLR